MATTYVQPGDTLTFTAPTGGVTSGIPVLIGALVVIPTATVAATLSFEGMVTGVHRVPKAGTQAWAEGALVYLDNTNHVFTTVSTGNVRAGIAAAAVGAGAGETTGYVRLNGMGAPTGA